MKQKNYRYTPGVCNIGPAEIKRRLFTGWLGLAVAAATGSVLFLLNAPAAFGILVFFPAVMSAVGFLQAGFHFCAAYGLMGVFNVLGKAGNTESVAEQEFVKKDKQKAIRIMLFSAGIAAVVAGILTGMLAYL